MKTMIYTSIVKKSLPLNIASNTLKTCLNVVFPSCRPHRVFFSIHSNWEQEREIDRSCRRKICYEEFTSLGTLMKTDASKLPSPHVKFKVLDYNILSNTHMHHHLGLYRKCPRQSLNWSYRKSILMQEFEELSPDIFCLQEVEEQNKDELFEPWTKRGYSVLYVHRGKGKPDGCAVLYNNAVFQAVDHTPVHYLRREVRIMDRPNVGIIVKLELKQHPGRYLVVANTHLLYNQKRQDIKLCQLVLLLAELDRIAYDSLTNSYLPIILTGDLNVAPDSGLISFLSEANVESRYVMGKKRKKFRYNDDGERVVPTEELENCLYINLNGCQFWDVAGMRKVNVAKQSKKTSMNINEKVDQLQDEKQSSSGSSNIKRSSSSDLSHGFSFVNIHKYPELDQRSLDKMKVFDYMFYSSNDKQTSGSLQLLSRLRLPTSREYNSQIRAIPNHAFGSDHFPLTATFLLTV